MSICLFENTHGLPPRNCLGFEGWMSQLLSDLAALDNWRCGNGATSVPSDANLNALFAPCTVPDPAWVAWVDTSIPLYPVLTLWANCSTSTDWDSDGDAIADREWLPYKGGLLNYVQHNWNDIGSKSSATWSVLPGWPHVTITTTGRPVLIKYSVTVTIDLNGIELAGGTGAQLRVTQNSTPLPTGLSQFCTMHSVPVGNWGTHAHDQQAGVHSWHQIIPLVAGTYTYALDWRVSGWIGGRLITVGQSNYNSLSVREL